MIGDRAWVLSRDEAVAAGWFGPVEPWLAGRIGDVVVAPAGAWRRRRHPGPSRWSPRSIGMHGSLTSADQLVPLLVSVPDSRPDHTGGYRLPQSDLWKPGSGGPSTGRRKQAVPAGSLR